MSADADEDGLDNGLLNELFSYIENNSDVGICSVSSGTRIIGVQGGSGLKLGGRGLAQEQALPRQQKRSSYKVSQGSAGSAGPTKRQRDADKVKELEAVIAAKTEQFTTLLQRNHELQFKSKILSDAVMLRDCQLRIVKDGGRSPVPLLMTAPPGVSVAAAAGQTDATLMQLQLLGSSAQVVHAPGSVRLLLAPEVLTAFQQTDVRAVGRQQVAASWKAFITEASALLLTLEVNPDDEAAACRMKQIAAEIASLCCRVSVLVPNTMTAAMQTHLETNELAAPEPGFWAQVLLSLQLTGEQLREMRAVYELFSGIMRSILADRRSIQVKLSAGLQADPRVMVALMHVPPEAEMLPALERNLRMEGAAHMLVRAFVFARTLSIIQMCRLAVHSYPYFPSATGLAAAAAGV